MNPSTISLSRVLGLACLGVLCASTWAPVAAREQPNVILIMADDVSWECFGCYDGEDYETPNIDRMAAEGVRFSHCYSTPICTTSRVKLMTGKYNFRNYTHFGYLNPAERTFGHIMQEAGYRTAIAGKWQLNGLSNNLPGFEDPMRPRQAGFHEHLLWQVTRGKGLGGGGGERFWSPVFEQNGRIVSIEENEGKYGPDLLCDFVCDFMQRNHNEPFFIYYPMVLVHDPFVPTPDTIGDGDRSHAANKPVREDKKKNFVAMVNYMDKIVGRILNQLEQIDELENTIVLFTADNGTNVNITSRWQGQQIKGGKGGMKDMGTHVPFVAFWAEHTPVGKVDDSLIEFTDFLPTLADAAGIELPGQSHDGVSFLPQLRGEEGPKREWVLCHYQPYWNKTPGQFVRNQAYKLYRDGRFYDLSSGDLLEQNDLTDSQYSALQSARQQLAEVIEQAPPAPRGKGTRETEHRPIYPDWQSLVPTGNR